MPQIYNFHFFIVFVVVFVLYFVMFIAYSGLCVQESHVLLLREQYAVLGIESRSPAVLSFHLLPHSFQKSVYPLNIQFDSSFHI